MPLGGVLLIVGLALLAAAGAFVVEWLLPAWRRQPINEVVGFVYAVVGVAYSVLLGLVVINGLTTLDTAEANVFAETNAVQQLYWYGSSLPQPRSFTSYIFGIRHRDPQMWPVDFTRSRYCPS